MDFVVISTPMSEYEKIILNLNKNLSDKTLITDVGSTRANVAKLIKEKLSKKLNWIMSHPISGSEASGPKYGSKNLFKNKWCILIKNKKKKLMEKKLARFWKKLGSKILFMNEEEHDKIFAVKPMNCPGCVQVFNQGLKSYRDLPLKMSEFGKVHRYEPSGALHGLLRVRAFTQDDAHIFCTEDQITEQSLSITNLILEIYKDLGFENVILKYSDRPDLRVGSDAVWDKSEKALLKAVKETKLDYSINKGEGAFYGPKIEFVLRDAIGRDWQCGTLQVDLNLPERLGASYVEKDGSKKVPVMLHRALFGSLERFIGILIENYSGKLPFWISPLQTVVIPVSDEFDEYSKKVNKQLIDAGFSSEVDLKNHNLNYKIRDHSLSKVPILLICGKKEVDSNSVTIRRLDSNKQENIELKKFITTHQALNKAPSL